MSTERRDRGFCAAAGLAFSVAAVIILIFSQVSQINHDLIPRHLRIVSIDTNGVSVALASAAKASGISALESKNFTAEVYNQSPAGEDYFVKATNTSSHQGLSRVYEWGLWSYCATDGELGDKKNYCYTRSIHPSFEPAKVLVEDIPSAYSDLLQQVLPSNVFTADDYLGTYSRSATYLILAGTLAAFLSVLIGLFARRFAFVLAALFSIISFLTLAAGTIIYQVIFSRTKSAIDDATTSGTDVGITVEYGNALWILWAATALMLASVVPFVIACCSGIRRRREARRVVVPLQTTEVRR